MLLLTLVPVLWGGGVFRVVCQDLCTVSVTQPTSCCASEEAPPQSDCDSSCEMFAAVQSLAEVLPPVGGDADAAGTPALAAVVAWAVPNAATSLVPSADPDPPGPSLLRMSCRLNC